MTIFLGAIRAAIRSWFSGAIMRSALEIWYQEGLLFQAGLPMVSPKVLASGAFWVMLMTSPSSAARSWQKLSWNLSAFTQR